MIKSKYTSAITDNPWWLAGGIPKNACVAAYQPIGASSYLASKVNLANPGTYDAADGAAIPTWGSTGWTFDGASSQYLVMGVTGIGQNWSAIVAFSGASTNDDAIFGATTSFRIWPRRGTGGTHLFSSAAQNLMPSGLVTSGVLAIAGTGCYKDGILEGNVAANSGVSSNVLWIGGQQGDGTRHWTGVIASIAFYNTPITGYQVAALTRAMNAL